MNCPTCKTVNPNNPKPLLSYPGQYFQTCKNPDCRTLEYLTEDFKDPVNPKPEYPPAVKLDFTQEKK